MVEQKSHYVEQKSHAVEQRSNLVEQKSRLVEQRSNLIEQKSHHPQDRTSFPDEFETGFHKKSSGGSNFPDEFGMTKPCQPNLIGNDGPNSKMNSSYNYKFQSSNYERSENMDSQRGIYENIPNEHYNNNPARSRNIDDSRNYYTSQENLSSQKHRIPPHHDQQWQNMGNRVPNPPNKAWQNSSQPLKSPQFFNPSQQCQNERFQNSDQLHQNFQKKSNYVRDDVQTSQQRQWKQSPNKRCRSMNKDGQNYNQGGNFKNRNGMNFGENRSMNSHRKAPQDRNTFPSNFTGQNHFGIGRKFCSISYRLARFLLYMQ